ncbi:hypothetical protein B0H19DRAFT_1099205 [Mycena capillaripes]|nr:hypothetical protein B0H19DRAFT_1099205 [Mycena capillaripes]
MAMMYYHWMVLPALLFPIGTLAAFIVDDFTKPALTCKPFILQWQGGKAPWTLSVLQASNFAVLENLGSFGVTSFNWNVDLVAGSSVLIQLQDSLGATATSQVLTTELGSTDCTLNNAATQQKTTAKTSATTSPQTLASTRITTSTTSTPAIVTTSSIALSLTHTGSASPSTIRDTNINPSPSSALIPPSTSALPSSSMSTTSISQTVLTGAVHLRCPDQLLTVPGIGSPSE